MFNIEQLTRDMPAAKFPVPSTKSDLAKTVKVTMDAWHQSMFGDTRRFDWSGSESTTHITAYNCAMRFSADPVFDRECRSALQHRKPSATVLFAGPGRAFCEVRFGQLRNVAALRTRRTG